mgnify:CR=1 FL=1
MSLPTWLEVAINGPWSRTRQPNIPVTADEIVEAALACAGEGASIIHFHAYDPVRVVNATITRSMPPSSSAFAHVPMSFAMAPCRLPAVWIRRSL